MAGASRAPAAALDRGASDYSLHERRKDVLGTPRATLRVVQQFDRAAAPSVAKELPRNERAKRARRDLEVSLGSAGGPPEVLERSSGGGWVATGDPCWRVQRSTMRRAATFLLTLCGAAAFVGRPSTTKTPVALRSTAETAAPTKRVITITPDALTHIKKLREDNGPDTHLRMGVRAGGRVRRRPRARARGAPAAVDRSSTGSERARRSRPRRAAGRADTTSLPPP